MEATIHPIENKKNYETVSEEIMRMIKNGQFPEGSRLPSEAELAEAFQIGRSSVREAIKSLQLTGIVISNAGKGTFVADNAVANVNYARLGELINSKEKLADLAETRLLLEPQMAGLAALRYEERDIREMERWITQMRNSDTKEDLLSYGHQFHRAVCKTCRNDVLIGLHNSISRQLLRMREMDFLTLDVYQRGIGEHQGILDAILIRDAALATERMRQHLLTDYSSHLR